MWSVTCIPGMNAATAPRCPTKMCFTIIFLVYSCNFSALVNIYFALVACRSHIYDIKVYCSLTSVKQNFIMG